MVGSCLCAVDRKIFIVVAESRRHKQRPSWLRQSTTDTLDNSFKAGSVELELISNEQHLKYFNVLIIIRS